MGLHGPEARARAAGVGAVQLAERFPRDRAGRRAVQLVPGPGELHRPGALRMDARQLVEPDEGRRQESRPSTSSSSSRSSSTASPTSACAKGQSEEDRYWTVGRVALWPNGFYLGRHFEWRVPVDDENTLSVAWFFVRVPKGREPYVQNSVPTWKSPIQRRGRPLDHQPRHQPGHRRLGRAGHDRRPHAGASALKRHRHHHDAQPLLRGARGDQGRPRPEGRDPRSEPGAVDRPAGHGARAEHGRHHARGIPERSAAAPAAQGIPPPLRPAARGAGGVRRGDGDRGS